MTMTLTQQLHALAMESEPEAAEILMKAQAAIAAATGKEG